MSGYEDVYQRAMNQGNSAAWDQSWSQAAEFFRQAVEEFPDRGQALTSLGLALFEMQAYDESLRYYGQAARVSPQDPLPVEKIAQIYERMGSKERSRNASLQAAELYLKNRDINKAIENWKRVLTLQPENMQARSRMALVLERMGRKEEAAVEYLAMAAIFQRAKDQPKAARAVQQALELVPGKQEAMEALSLLRENRLLPMPLRPKLGTAPLRSASMRQLEQDNQETARKADPVSEARQAALTSLAAVLFDTVDENTSEAGNRRGIQAIMQGSGLQSKSVDRTRIVLHLGQLVELQSQGEYDKAANELERAMDAGLDHPAASYDLGYLQFQLGRNDQAMKNLQQAVSHPDFSLGARLLLGQIYYRSNQLREASVAYMHALSLADVALAPVELAEALRQQYDPLIEAQSHETNNLIQRQVCDNIAGLLQEANWRENIRQARQQLSADTGAEEDEIVPLAEVLTQSRSSQIVESLARIKQMDRGGYLRTAMEEAFYAVQYAPTYLPLHAQMAELLLKQGQRQEGQDKLLVVAQSYASRGEARRATQIYRRVIELAPMDLNPRIRLIDQLVAGNQGEDALKEYMDFADVYYALADLEKSRRTLSDALKLAQQSRVDKSWQVRILHRMADIDLQSLDWRQAVRIFEQIRNLQPDDEKSRASLVDLNSRLGQDDRALAELDNYLSYLAGKGQRERAVKFLEGLVREDPSRTWTRRRLAEFYQALGRNADAISQWDALGDLLIDAGDVTAAIHAIESIMSLRPPNLAEYQRLLVQLRTGGKA